MSQADGKLSYFGWKDQSAYATAATPPNKWVEVTEINVSDDRKMKPVKTLGHVSKRRWVRDVHQPGFTVKFPFSAEGSEQLLKHALGSVVTTGPSGAIYTHTYGLAAALPAYGFTAYIDIDTVAIGSDVVQQCVGCKVEKLTLSQEMGEPLMVELEVVGREFIDVARTSPTLPTYDAFDYGHMTTAKISPGGDNVALQLTKWKMEVNNSLFKDKRTLTSAGKRTDLVRGDQRSVMMEMEVEFESDDVFSYFKSAAATDLDFRWANSSKEIILTTLAGYFQGSRPSATTQGPVYFTAPYEATAYSADNDEMTFVLKNTTSSV